MCPKAASQIPLGIAIPVLMADRHRHRHELPHYPHAALAAMSLRSAAIRKQPNSPASRPGWVTVRIFALMGALCAIAAAISTARLNAATNCAGHARRTLYDRGCGHRRHLACRRRGHDLWSGSRCDRHAIPAIRHGAAAYRYAAAEHRHRHRAGHGRLAGHRLSRPGQVRGVRQ